MSKRTLLPLLILTLLTPVGLPGLAQEGEDRLQIVASFTILADVIQNVAGDAADVTALTPPGADPHSFTPTPRDLVALTEAGAVFVVGASFEEGLSATIENASADINLVVASSCVDIQPFGSEPARAEMHEGEAPQPEGEIAAMCEAHHAALEGRAPAPGAHVHTLGMLYNLNCGEHEPEAESGEHRHEAGSCDPHVWTDPYNVMLWALRARDALSALDPANAATYAANAEAYIVELAALFEKVTAMIETIPPENRKLVTNHLAYGYYANRFGLEMIGTVIPAASTLAEPSAAQVAALIDAIKAQGVPAVFADSTANPDLARQVAGETGAQFYQLYTGSLTESDGPAPTYIDYILVDTQIIVEALGGAVE
ncbi:MAG: zinc ABC transporter substrate-binding protein [Anaerolineae bacterium]|nr:zinc ABC transporter substrate-binding protein [Anaerolineae bacterium]